MLFLKHLNDEDSDPIQWFLYDFYPNLYETQLNNKPLNMRLANGMFYGGWVVERGISSQYKVYPGTDASEFGFWAL